MSSASSTFHRILLRVKYENLKALAKLYNIDQYTDMDQQELIDSIMQAATAKSAASTASSKPTKSRKLSPTRTISRPHIAPIGTHADTKTVTELRAENAETRSALIAAILARQNRLRIPVEKVVPDKIVEPVRHSRSSTPESVDLTNYTIPKLKIYATTHGVKLTARRKGEMINQIKQRRKMALAAAKPTPPKPEPTPEPKPKSAPKQQPAPIPKSSPERKSTPKSVPEPTDKRAHAEYVAILHKDFMTEWLRVLDTRFFTSKIITVLCEHAKIDPHMEDTELLDRTLGSHYDLIRKPLAKLIRDAPEGIQHGIKNIDHLYTAYEDLRDNKIAVQDVVRVFSSQERVQWCSVLQFKFNSLFNEEFQKTPKYDIVKPNLVKKYKTSVDDEISDMILTNEELPKLLKIATRNGIDVDAVQFYSQAQRLYTGYWAMERGIATQCWTGGMQFKFNDTQTIITEQYIDNANVYEDDAERSDSESSEWIESADQATQIEPQPVPVRPKEQPVQIYDPTNPQHLLDNVLGELPPNLEQEVYTVFAKYNVTDSTTLLNALWNENAFGIFCKIAHKYQLTDNGRASLATLYKFFQKPPAPVTVLPIEQATLDINELPERIRQWNKPTKQDRTRQLIVNNL